MQVLVGDREADFGVGRRSCAVMDDEARLTALQRHMEENGCAHVFAEHDPSRTLVRLCFGKKDETIDAGVSAMAKAKEILA